MRQRCDNLVLFSLSHVFEKKRDRTLRGRFIKITFYFYFVFDGKRDTSPYPIHRRNTADSYQAVNDQIKIRSSYFDYYFI